MGILLAFAFLSGIITILSPCILPVLPIVLAGSVGRGKSRSLGIVAGFVFSFTVFTLTLTILVQALGISADVLRYVAVAIIILFGLVLVIPPLHEWFSMLASKIANAGKSSKPKDSRAPAEEKKSSGFWAGIPVGFSLGLVWTPCAGPIMASVISLALTERLDSGAVLITLVYSLGTAIPMLAVMLGGRALLNRVPVLLRNTGKIQKIFGVLMIVVGISIGFGWDRQFQAAILKLFPDYGSGLTALENSDPVRKALAERRGQETGGEKNSGDFRNATPPVKGRLGNYGPAPDFVTDGRWYNTADLLKGEMQPQTGEGTRISLEDLRGKVVLIDFWTYSCVNCVRTIPALQSWYKTYKDKGFTIIGVHTPEFEFEKKPANVEQAMKDLGVVWPVVLDNDYDQWNAYANHYWPAHYFIDAAGQVRYFSFGEGHYKESEQVIRALLEEAGSDVRLSGTGGKEVTGPGTSLTPETYLGYGRGRRFASAVTPAADTFTDYRPAKVPGESEWNLTGRWMIAREYIIPETTGILELGFTARNVFLVVEPETAGQITVSIDNNIKTNTPDVMDGVLVPTESRLYQLVALKTPGQHLLHLEVKGKLRLFAFTFG